MAKKVAQHLPLHCFMFVWASLQRQWKQAHMAPLAHGQPTLPAILEYPWALPEMCGTKMDFQQQVVRINDGWCWLMMYHKSGIVNDELWMRNSGWRKRSRSPMIRWGRRAIVPKQCIFVIATPMPVNHHNYLNTARRKAGCSASALRQNQLPEASLHRKKIGVSSSKTPEKVPIHGACKSHNLPDLSVWLCNSSNCSPEVLQVIPHIRIFKVLERFAMDAKMSHKL